MNEQNLARVIDDRLAERKREKLSHMSNSEKLAMQKAQLLAKVSIPDLIDESKFIWTVSAVQAPRQFWSYGQNIEVLIQAGNYICNVAKSQMIHRPIIKQAFSATTANNQVLQNRLLCLNNAKSAWHLVSLTFDGIEAIDQQGERSRPIANAVLSRFKESSSSKDSASMGEYDDLRFKMSPDSITLGAGAITLANATSVTVQRAVSAVNMPQYFIDEDNTFAQPADAVPYLALPAGYYSQMSQYVYLYQSFEQYDWRKRFYVIQQATSKIAQLQPVIIQAWSVQNYNVADSNTAIGALEDRSYVELEFGDMCQELASLQNVPMNMFSTGIRMQWRLVEPNYCMSLLPRVQSNAGDNAMLFKATDTYYMTDISVKLRSHIIMTDKLPLIREIAYGSVYPYITYSYKRWPITATNQVQFNFGITAGNLLGMFTVITPSTGLVYDQALTAQGIGYYDDGVAGAGTPASVFGACYNRYDMDHLYVKTNRQYLQVENDQYSTNQLNIPSRQFASYTEALSESSILFPNRRYNVQLNEFLTNRYCYFTAVNNHGVRGLNVRGKQLGFFAEFNDPVRVLPTKYDMHIFLIHTKNLVFDQSKGVIIE